MTFADLDLVPPLLEALDVLGYQTPTPVQEKAIPAVLAGGDLMAAAQTGTGKTASFALPLLQRLAHDPEPTASNSTRALILVPTRELAQQVCDSFIAYGQFLVLRSYAVYGGVSINPQMMKLRKGVDILVATPGRLLDPSWSVRGPLDVIFCRNVMIYFDKPTQYKILSRFAPMLNPEGLMFAGHSESFLHAADLFRSLGKTVYELARKPG